MIIEKATIQDNGILTEITKQSKAYWGYSAEQILLWSDLLTITPNYIEDNSVFKLVTDEKIIGYYAYFNVNDTIVKLDNLFLLPEFIGKGFGKLLMRHFLTRVKQSPVNNIILDAEPNTEAFYKKFGFVTTGKLETTIKNRFLPVMELKIH